MPLSAGYKIIIFAGVLKIVLFIVLAPLIGLVSSVVFTVLIMWLFRKSQPAKANRTFRWLQLVSASVYSIGHGTNDAQKTMGVIALALFSGGITHSFKLEPWIVISCYCAISLGTMLGGWRIVKTMGTQITKVHCMEGFCAETASALVLLGTAHFGIPVSTTHVIAGSLMGVGSAARHGNVRWVTARKIIWSWLLTIPLTAACSAIAYWVVSIFV